MTATLLSRPAGPGRSAGSGPISGWSVTGVLFGGLALSGVLVAPIFGLLGLAGLPVAAVALTRAVHRPGVAAGAAGMNALAIALAASLLLAGAPAGPAAAGAGPTGQSQAVGPQVSLLYEVEGAGSGSRMAYSAVTGGTSGAVSTQSAALPWREQLLAPVGGSASERVYSLTATSAASAAGQILCRITVNGLLLTQQVAYGTGATVRCTATTLRGQPAA